MRKEAKNHQRNFLAKCLLIFTLLVFSGSLVFGSVYSKNTKFTLNMENVTLEQVFNTIESQSEFIFFYKSDVVDVDKTVSVKTENRRVEFILDKIFEGENVSYEVIDRQIIIKKQDKKPAEKENNSSESINTEVQASVQQPGEIEVSGQVVDAESGDPLPGVSIWEQGNQTNGTTTDMDGNYSITVPSDASLIFSFVGYQRKTVPVNGREEIRVEMQQQVQEMEEVVVVGYGQQSQITTTGAISSVKADEMEKASMPTVGEALTGKVTGLSSVQTTGQPGASDPSIYLRGIGTMNDANPLIIIDGVPNTMRSFMQLNPSNIQNISVLKDASSTAVYGVKGANGAIIVNTKRGQAGKTTIRADVSYGMQRPTNLPNFVGSYRWAKFNNIARRNDGNTADMIPQYHIEHYRKQDLPTLFPSIDYRELLLNNSAMQARGNINISGGTEDVKYFSSIGYFKQDGLLDLPYESTGDFTYDRYNLRTNVDLNVTPTTEVSFTSNARIGLRSKPKGNMWFTINLRPPVGTAGVVDNKLISPKRRYQPYISEQDNPFDRIYKAGYNQTNEYRLNLNMDVNQKLKALDPALEGLEFRTKLGYRAGFNEYANYNGPGHAEYISLYNVHSPNPNPSLSDSTVVLQKLGEEGTRSWDRSYSANRYIYWEAGLDYETTINNNNNVKALLLYNQNKNYYPSNLTYPEIPTGNVGLVGRVTYNYNKQYMLEVNMGYNGSENFAKKQRFGWFPSVSGSWVVSKENFMQGIGFLDHLKLRFSYGIVGSDQTSGGARFIYIGDRYVRSGNQFQGYNFGNNIPEFRQGTYEAGVGNENITWETAKKQNYGVDIELFDERLSLTANYFYEYRDDILMYRNSAPSWLAVDLPPLNIGEMENEGFEVQATWQKQTGDFNYSISGNISRAENTVLYMDEVPPREPYQTMTGHSLGTRFGYIWEGFYSQEDIQKIQSGELPEPRAVEVHPGDMRYKDLNGDGIIDQADRKPYGYPAQPQVTGGLNLDFSYRGFDLSMGFQGAAEVSRSPWGVFRTPLVGGGTLGPVLKTFYDNHWTEERAENGNVKWPRPSFVNSEYNHRPSTFYNRNSSYIRLRNAEFGYTFSGTSLQNAGIQRLRVYVRGNNMFTIVSDEFMGIDPERQPNLNMGYPLVKLYKAGLNITF
jgi:TonB-linked SusC/RagA family outer membrane protein